MSFMCPLAEVTYNYEVVGDSSAVPRTVVDKTIVEFLVSSPFDRPSAQVVLQALDWRRKLYAVGFVDISAFPGYAGEILLSAIKGDFCFEITIETDRSLTIAFERRGTDLISADRLDENQAREKLIEAARLIWILSVGFIQFTSIPGKDRTGSKALLSKTSTAAFL